MKPLPSKVQEWIESEWPEIDGHYNRNEYMRQIKDGAERTANHLMQVIRLQREALEFYANGRHLWAESEDKPENVCDPIGHTAKQALTQSREILGDKESE